MTGTELLTNTVALLNETNTGAYEGFAVPLINLILADNFALNNNVRLAAGKDALDDAPSIEALSETLPCEDALSRAVMQYGLVLRLIAEDGDFAKIAYYEQLYAAARNAADRKAAVVEWY